MSMHLAECENFPTRTIKHLGLRLLLKWLLIKHILLLHGLTHLIHLIHLVLLLTTIVLLILVVIEILITLSINRLVHLL